MGAITRLAGRLARRVIEGARSGQPASAEAGVGGAAHNLGVFLRHRTTRHVRRLRQGRSPAPEAEASSTPEAER